jgi:hypothetical protein
MSTNETGRARKHDPIRPSGSESLVGIVPPGGAADTQLRSIIDRPRATRASPCPYCGRPIRVGDRIDKTYVRIGGGKAWAQGRCGEWWLHSHCARKADARRRREPPLSRVERDEIKARALGRGRRGSQRWRNGQARRYIPADELPAFEAAAERVARRRRKVRDERRGRSPGVR